MKKELLLPILSVAILAGCGTSTGTTSDLEEIGKAMEDGTAMTCVIKSTDDSAQMAADMTYYIDGENIRVESDFNGEKMIAIQKGEETYVQPNSMMGETDCEWIVASPEDEEDTGNAPDFDYEQYEENPMYEMICDKGAVDASQFATSGKVCTTEEMMQGAIKNMMPEGVDLSGLENMMPEGVDMGQFQ